MKTNRILLLLLPFLMAGIPLITGGCSPKSSNQQSAEKAIWTCSMHQQIRQDHPGDCPICGMALVPLRSLTPPASPINAPSPPEAQKPTLSAIPEQAKETKETIVHLDAAQSSVSSIKTAPVEERKVQRKVDLFGEIAYISDGHTDFTWYYGGRIQKVLIDFNTTEVSAGTPILEVYSDEAIADQRSYLETLRQRWLATFYERKNFDAQLGAIAERLSRIGITPEDLKALEKGAKIRSIFTIRAPRSGSILGGLPSAGERFTADKPLFHLAPLDQVWFVADVYEQDLSLLKLGQEIRIRCRAHPEDVFNGKLVFIDRQVDPQKRTVKARFLVPNPKRLLLPQLSATGTLELGVQKSLLAVPASAVIDTGRRQLVYVETAPNTYELRTVKVGAEGELSNDEASGSFKWVPVIEGLKVGEKVVTAGAFLIDAEAQMQGLPASGAEPSLKQPER
jgi:Cu(I)/Ag(I) efflux system membrane fusion protein